MPIQPQVCFEVMSQQGRLLRNFLHQLIRFLQENKQANKQRQKQNKRKESGILESYVSVSNIDRYGQHRNVTSKDCICVTPRHS